MKLRHGCLTLLLTSLLITQPALAITRQHELPEPNSNIDRPTQANAVKLEVYGSQNVGDQVQLFGSLPATMSLAPMKFVSATIQDNDGAARTISALAVGADQRPLITYYIGNKFNLAQCQTVTCTSASAIHTLDPSIMVWVHNYTSMAVDKDGLPVIAYQSNQQEVGFAVTKCLDVTCGTITTTVLERGGGIAYSLAIAPDDLPVIAYLDVVATPSVLKLAKCLDPACTRATIKTLETTSTGGGMALAIGADGLPIISYVLNSTNTLKVFKCQTADCETGIKTTLDPQSSTNWWTRLVIGSDGLPAISYFDLNIRRLKLAKCLNIDCTAASFKSIGALPNVDGGIGMTIGADNLPMITYANGIDGSLEMALCQTANCENTVVVTVDATPVGAPGPNMVMGADGQSLMSYFNQSASTIKIAKALPEISYTLNYGDGTPTVQGNWNARVLPFAHRYRMPGAYTAVITMTSGAGGVMQTASASTLVLVGQTYLPMLQRD